MRTVKQTLEQWEEQTLSPLAQRSSQSRGRERPLSPCDLRTEYQRDRDRIIHSKGFRRLQFKTQVFISPEGDHYRTRLTHTLEVAQVARTISRALRLNEDLTEAIALAHDLGHTPFGHIGERTLNRLLPGGFRHNEQSLRMVEVLEGKHGLNLTWEVRDGIRSHPGSLRAATLEGQVVGRADRIAYINHDIDDALRAGLLKPYELPREPLRKLGQSHGERISSMIADVVKSSRDKDGITMSSSVQEATDQLRTFLFERVYQHGWRTEEEKKCDHILTTLYEHFLKHPASMPLEYVMGLYRDGAERPVGDYLASMTDRFAIRTFERLFVPERFSVM